MILIFNFSPSAHLAPSRLTLLNHAHQDDEGADVDDEGRSDDEGSAGDGSDDKGDGDDGDGEGDGTGDESGDDDADKGELSRESRRGSKPQAVDCSPIWCAALT